MKLYPKHKNKSCNITKMIMQLFDHWRLTHKQQAVLLNLSTNDNIAHYRCSYSSLTQDQDTIDRIAHLLAIHKSLRILFPYNKKLAYAWPTIPNRHFNGKTPIEIMGNKGSIGLVNIRRYLETQKNA